MTIIMIIEKSVHGLTSRAISSADLITRRKVLLQEDVHLMNHPLAVLGMYVLTTLATTGTNHSRLITTLSSVTQALLCVTML